MTPGTSHPATLTLTPNTGIVLTGVATVSSMIDGNVIAQWLPGTKYETWYLQAETDQFLNPHVEVSLGRSGNPVSTVLNVPPSATGGTAYILGEMGSSSISTDLCNYTLMRAVDAPDTLARSVSLSHPFELTFSNATNAASNTDITLTATASSFTGFGAAFSLPGDPTVPTIPEPGTYALMGLGLAGIALARRRHAVAEWAWQKPF